MKKVLLLMLVMAICIGLLACGNPNEGKSDDAKETTQDSGTQGTDSPNAPTPVLNMEQLYAEMTAKVSVPEMLTLSQDLMLDFCGIQPEDVKQAVVVICANSLRTDEIWLLEATSDAAATRLIDLANNRLATKGAESKTYSPEQYAVVQKAKLIQKDQYIALIVSPDVETLAAYFQHSAGL